MFLLKQYRQIVSFFPECQIVGTAKDTFQFPSAGKLYMTVRYSNNSEQRDRHLSFDLKFQAYEDYTITVERYGRRYSLE